MGFKITNNTTKKRQLIIRMKIIIKILMDTQKHMANLNKQGCHMIILIKNNFIIMTQPSLQIFNKKVNTS